MTILVITTGGTIGALPYNDLKRQPKVKAMPAKGQDFVRAALQKIPGMQTRCVSLEARDSSLIDDAYMKAMLPLIETAPENAILVTVGTDRILDIANFIHRQRALSTKLKNKTIILTGAMVALSCGPESDGLLNLRFALRHLSQGQINAGVYIVLCDYQDQSQSGWQPKLYRFEPGQYEKFYDPDDDRRNRLRRLAS